MEDKSDNNTDNPANGGIDKHLELFSKIAIDVLKELASKGEELTPESLLLSMKSNKEIQDITVKGSDTEPLEEESQEIDKPHISSEIDDLKLQIQTAQTQKDQLIKQIDEIEDIRFEADSFYKRVMIFFIGMLNTPDNITLEESFDQFKDLIKKDLDYKKLEGVFLTIKDQTLKADIKKKGVKVNRAKPFSFFAKFLKSDLKGIDESQFEANYFKQLTESYQEIVDELKLSLGEKFFKKILRIEKRIGESDCLDDLHTIRGDILSLIHEYIASVCSDREKVAAFIKEIGKRLITMEKIILGSFKRTREAHSENKDFNKILHENIESLKQSVGYSKTLEQLQEAVVATLETLKNAIEDKTKRDSLQMETAARKIKSASKEMEDMKKRMASAKEHADHLEEELLIDSLTGVFNRRAYDKRIKEEMERYLRYKHTFSLMILDVDHFKQINDNYGHAIGDKCLKEIINHIKPNLRKTDILYRFGGEEFVALLPETESKSAIIVAEKMRQVVEKIEFIHKEDTVQITISIGVTQAKPMDNSQEIIFSRMDKAVYEAKNTGRNKVVVM